MQEAPQELEDERLNDRRGRYHNMPYMMARVQTYLLAKPTQFWLDAFTASDIPAARVNDIGELRDDPHLQAVGFFQKRTHPTEGDYWETQPPVIFKGQEKREISPAPLIGEQTNEVLAELGLGHTVESDEKS